MAEISRHNADIIKEGFKNYRKYILDATERELKKYCWGLLNSAITSRERNDRAYNYTGNLLNSIVVCLYRKGQPVIAYFSSSLVPEAIYPKMSGPRKRSYVFRPDYEGVYDSKYRPTVPTNKGWGKDDAERFFEEYTPRGRNMFDIVVAYTVEYAEWVEVQRQTTGIIDTYDDAKRVGLTFMQLSA